MAVQIPTPDRRAIVSGIVGALSGAALAAPNAAASVASQAAAGIDPALLAVAEHRRRRATMAAMPDEGFAYEELYRADEDGLQAMAHIVPTTKEGAIEMLSYMLDCEGDFCDDNSPLVATARTVVAALRTL